MSPIKHSKPEPTQSGHVSKTTHTHTHTHTHTLTHTHSHTHTHTLTHTHSHTHAEQQEHQGEFNRGAVYSSLPRGNSLQVTETASEFPARQCRLVLSHNAPQLLTTTGHLVLERAAADSV